MTKEKDLTIGNPIKLITYFAIPLMLGSIFQQMYTMVDSIIVGQGVGVDALAAIGSGDWITWIAVGIIHGITQGYSVLFANSFGAKNYKKLKDGFAQSIILSITLSVLLMVIMQFSLKPILVLIKTDPKIIDTTLLYLRIYYCGILLNCGYNLISGMIRALGDSKDPLLVMVIASIVNIVLDCIFVFIFKWGVKGAAIATVLSQGVSFVLSLMILRQFNSVQLSKENFKLNFELQGELIRLGAPLGLMNIIIAVGGIIVQMVVNGFGLSIIAGYTVNNKCYGLLELAAVSYGSAVATFIAQNKGANKLDRIKQGLTQSTIVGILISFIITIAVILFGRQLSAIFIADGNNKAEVVEIAYRYLKLMGYFLWVLYILHIHRSALQGLGNTFIPFCTSFIELFMRIIAALTLPGIIGDIGVIWAEDLAWIGSALLLVFTTIKTIYVKKDNI